MVANRIVHAHRRVTRALRPWGLSALAVATLVTHDAIAMEVPFGTQSVISSSADDAFSVFAADVDGDGDTDVLSASFNDDTIAWYENNGASPPTWTAQTVRASGGDTRSILA